MRDKGHWDNFIEVNGIFEKSKELVFIVIKFILAIGKNICQRELFMRYHIDTTPLLVDMDNCYWTFQLYHRPVRSCFILQKKESRIYAGSGVSQTPKKGWDMKAVCMCALMEKLRKESYAEGEARGLIKTLRLHAGLFVCGASPSAGKLMESAKKSGLLRSPEKHRYLKNARCYNGPMKQTGIIQKASFCV